MFSSDDAEMVEKFQRDFMKAVEKAGSPVVLEDGSLVAPLPAPARFGVKVTRDPGDGTWSVTLPHQCDEWHIEHPEHSLGVTHQAAFEALTSFIRELQDARAAMLEGREFGHD